MGDFSKASTLPVRTNQRLSGDDMAWLWSKGRRLTICSKANTLVTGANQKGRRRWVSAFTPQEGQIRQISRAENDQLMQHSRAADGRVYPYGASLSCHVLRGLVGLYVYCFRTGQKMDPHIYFTNDTFRAATGCGFKKLALGREANSTECAVGCYVGGWLALCPHPCFTGFTNRYRKKNKNDVRAVTLLRR
jgi:hypothetical protein